MSGHAVLAPSAGATWLTCAASVALTHDAPDETSAYAEEGTLAHALAAYCLTTVGADPYAVKEIDGKPIPADMPPFVGEYVETIRGLWSHASEIGGELFIEQRVDITGYVPECHGTADAIIVNGSELQVHDLKYGRGAAVTAEDNVQLMLYALGALDLLSLAYDFETVRLFIHQPRNGGTTEHVVSVDALQTFGMCAGEYARAVLAFRDQCEGLDFDARLALLPASAYAATEKGCQWCKAKARCPALAAYVREQVGDIEAVVEPDANTATETLGRHMAAVGLIADWCKAVRAEVERRLLAGQSVPGYKLVQGRRGPRSWVDEAAALDVLKSFRLKHEQIYDYKLASPTSIEKVLRESPRKWKRAAELITQRDGKPSVALEADKRPAIVVSPVGADIDDLTTKEI